MKVKCPNCGHKHRVNADYTKYKRGAIGNIKKILDNIGFDDRKKVMAIKVIVSGELLIRKLGNEKEKD